MIRDDEVHTGRKSTLPWDAPLSQVLQNENVLEALTERTWQRLERAQVVKGGRRAGDS